MIHTIFPLAIGEYDNADHEPIKTTFLNNLNDYLLRQEDGTCIVGESTGINNIHCEQRHDNLFSFIIKSFRNHFDSLRFNHNIFDIAITKTWLNILDGNISTPAHIHETSHYSFVYYINVPVNSDFLCFSQNRNANEPYQGAFFDHAGVNSVKTLVHQYNELNSLEWSFPPGEGKLYIFPSHINHFTKKIGSMNDGLRISVAGDVLLLYKEQYRPNYPTGLFPVSQWKRFD
jgi:hypothetical protein